MISHRFTSEMSCDECPPARRAPASSRARIHLPFGQRARAVFSHCPEPLSRADRRSPKSWPKMSNLAAVPSELSRWPSGKPAAC